MADWYSLLSRLLLYLFIDCLLLSCYYASAYIRVILLVGWISSPCLHLSFDLSLCVLC
ncbi:hypothetical protein NA56DRAFT_645087 [Hyaloscypha hepaticicola]|uniref:Uncharacterized protein n=1 Tax=Hyaloscypha hepaticicola TaxID=2082293 RepID=A0A2J6Q6G8_9HELO|nr:hypothetical protein NA56DRAFT_645087 [Hyaloscypha hepaticicola]